MKTNKNSEQKSKTPPVRIQEQKINATQHIKQYWSEHRTTLIAFQAQYVYSKKTETKDLVDPSDSNGKKKKSSKKNMAFDSAFLFGGNDQQLNIMKLIHESQCIFLKNLFQEDTKLDPDMQQLKEFIKIMLQLKHESIVREFMEIYNIVVRQIKDVPFDQICKDSDRTKFLKVVQTCITQYVLSNSQKFKYFMSYMNEDRKDTTHFFYVTAYCFLAEKHNFNINQFFCEGFDVSKEEEISQKIYREDKNNQESP